MPGLSSAAGLIGLLDERDASLKSYALVKLDELVDQFWAQIADDVSKMWVPPKLCSPKHHIEDHGSEPTGNA
jgi:hypothetical protein